MHWLNWWCSFEDTSNKHDSKKCFDQKVKRNMNLYGAIQKLFIRKIVQKGLQCRDLGHEKRVINPYHADIYICTTLLNFLSN